MDTLSTIFGVGKDLTALQMACRAISIFIITLILIRISGRRSFGIRTPLDNIIVILLGAILSRAIVGVSPFFPVVAASFTIVIIHRFIAWLTVKNAKFRTLIDGNKKVVYKNGRFVKDNMERTMACEEDIMQGIRKSALTDDLNKIDKVFMESTGEITVVKKQTD